MGKREGDSKNVKEFPFTHGFKNMEALYKKKRKEEKNNKKMKKFEIKLRKFKENGVPGIPWKLNDGVTLWAWMSMVKKREEEESVVHSTFHEEINH